MTRPVSSDTLEVLTSRRQTVRYAVMVDDGTTVYRWCTGADPVTINSEVYRPRNLLVGAVPVSERGSEVRINVDDAVGDLRGAHFSGGFQDASVKVYLQGVDEDGRGTTPELVFSGWVTAVSSRGAEFVLECAALKQSYRNVGLRPMDRHCNLRPGGPYCGLAAAKGVCNGTWASCVSLGNTARFGGLRFAPADGEVILVGRYAGVIRRAK